MHKSDGRFILDDVQTDYPELLRFLRDNGQMTSPRGMETREIFDIVMVLDPHRAIVTGINRGLNLKLISMEALQLITCTSWPQRTIKAAPNMANFLNGESFHGAYGVRIGAQLEAVLNRLKSDKDSRQAVMTIWDPVLDSFRGTQANDIPCTTMLQFFIRNDKLILHVTMRSNDVWWGTPHDWGQFSQLQLAIAKVLGIEAGKYYHHAVSFHLYARDYDKIDALTEPTASLFVHDGFGSYSMTLSEMQDNALILMTNPNDFTPRSNSDHWHLKRQLSISNND